MFTERMSQRIAVVGQLQADSTVVGTTLTQAIDMALHARVLFIVDVGTIGASATVNFKVRASATAGGTYADITGKAITAISTSTNIALVEVQASDLPAGTRFIKGSLTVATAATGVCVLALASDDRFAPASDQNLAAVNQYVA